MPQVQYKWKLCGLGIVITLGLFPISLVSGQFNIPSTRSKYASRYNRLEIGREISLTPGNLKAPLPLIRETTKITRLRKTFRCTCLNRSEYLKLNTHLGTGVIVEMLKNI